MLEYFDLDGSICVVRTDCLTSTKVSKIIRTSNRLHYWTSSEDLKLTCRTESSLFGFVIEVASAADNSAFSG